MKIVFTNHADSVAINDTTQLEFHQKLLEDYDTDNYRFLKQYLSESETMTVQTSGSTGEPKMIEIKKESMRQSARLTLNYFGLTAGDTILQCLPTKFIAGKMIWVRAMVGNLDLLVAKPSANPLVDLNQKVDFAAMTPHQVSTALANNPHKFDLIKILIIGGGSVSPTLHVQLQELKTHCYATYGMTETITHIAIKRLNGISASNYYTALQTISLTANEDDCLCIAAPHISNKSIITNDIVNLIDAQSFEWLGRKDFVINSGGVKLFPDKIASKIAHLFSNRFFIHKIKDAEYGEVPVLVVEGNTSMTIAQLKPYLNKIETPKQIFAVPKFHETESGKVDVLRTMEGQF